MDELIKLKTWLVEEKEACQRITQGCENTVVTVLLAVIEEIDIRVNAITIENTKSLPPLYSCI